MFLCNKEHNSIWIEKWERKIQSLPTRGGVRPCQNRRHPYESTTYEFARTGSCRFKTDSKRMRKKSPYYSAIPSGAKNPSLLLGSAFFMIPGLGPILAVGPIKSACPSRSGQAVMGGRVTPPPSWIRQIPSSGLQLRLFAATDTFHEVKDKGQGKDRSTDERSRLGSRGNRRKGSRENPKENRPD